MTAIPAPITASPNGAGAVANYNMSVAQLQKRIPELETLLSNAQAKLAELLANPVVLHEVAAAPTGAPAA